MKKRIKLISLAVAAGMLISATNVSAYTRQYTFHMNTSYAHGKEPNYGYAATKDDNEAIAYITMTRYKINSGTPQILCGLPQAEHMLRQPMPGHGLEQLLANH